ncbi:uncharacterized protein PHACADRAFT_129400 [Phanerochaete carnosa HHB-10118-sp]|uniref:Peptidase A2 domain-containing protein n=1 Tax=Phanerochaete carnosa (strain HHB-10118-sp) TaxID=650164 RepID=K5UNV7_PHACS|nr:uncharacterized protein PHACADRAFT_129400 [Phanerochaete carnosa HHB-10118-sp]EKM51436.1 hypothetical protein PHACADRAFT_129400 [Phanerochaete carnosa HHB-10118-sp]
MNTNPSVSLATVPLALPLPLPSSKDAPYFNGRRVKVFLETIEYVGKSAGYGKAQWPSLILRYSSSEVKKTLAKEEDVLNGTDWDAAKERLLFYYESSSSSKRCTPKKLKDFVSKSSKKKITSRQQVDRYHRRFSKKAGKLVDDKKITQAESDYLFYKGLPRKVRSSIKPRLTALLAAQNKELLASSPAAMADTLAAARALYDPDDIDYSDVDDRSSSSSDSDERSDGDMTDDTDDESSTDSGRRLKRKGRKMPKRGRSREGDRRRRGKKDESRSRSRDGRRTRLATGDRRELRDLAESVKQLQVAVQTQVVAQSQAAVQTGIGSRPLFRENSPVPTQAYPQGRTCYMCGKVEGVDLEHRIGMGNCPETIELINSGHILYSPMGQLIRKDGTLLPRSLGSGSGGIAAIVRREISSAGKGKERDLPPHQSRMGMNVGLYADGKPVLGGRTTAVASETVYAFPTTRAQAKAGGDGGVEKQVRFEEEEAQPTWKKSFRAPNVHRPADPSGEFTRKKGAEQSQSAPHPANTEEGWRERQRQKARVEEGTDDEGHVRPKQAKSNPYRFTSTVQEQVSTENIREQVLDTKITLSLREILGMSPELQRIMQALVKTRREFNVKSGERASDVENSAEEIQILSPDEPGTAFLTYGEGEDLRQILEKYASAVVVGARRHFAMTVGLVKGVFGGEKVTFLVDSGSELNLITRRVWEQTETPLDEDGRRWSLQGIGGESVALLGCARDAPVQISGKNFDHNFFVSTREHGAYDGILGQPWLSWFSADVSYNRAGPTYLRAYPSGDKTGAFISIEICQTNHPRNTDRLILTTTSSIERDMAAEVEEVEEDF